MVRAKNALTEKSDAWINSTGRKRSKKVKMLVLFETATEKPEYSAEKHYYWLILQIMIQ
ncbi:hypothetical protein Q5O24_07265 [Eubacteriaceae bacterium ES3]|nr:hypothetical protein Q5O24_07265 [Eubacteriaceae bacterium ES3]